MEFHKFEWQSWNIILSWMTWPDWFETISLSLPSHFRNYIFFCLLFSHSQAKRFVFHFFFFGEKWLQICLEAPGLSTSTWTRLGLRLEFLNVLSCECHSSEVSAFIRQRATGNPCVCPLSRLLRGISDYKPALSLGKTQSFLWLYFDMRKR